MKHVLMALACLLFASVSCLAGEKTQKVNINDRFDAINVSSVVKVVYTVAPKTEVKIKADETVINKVKIGVVKTGKSSVLNVATENLDNFNGEIVVNIKAPAVRAVNVAGASDFIVNGSYSVGELAVNASGAADVRFHDVNASRIAVSAVGDADVKFGNVMAEQVALNASGTGEVKVKLYQGNELAANATGASEIKIDNVAITSLAVNTSGTAEVEIAGRASQIALNASGHSEIDLSKLPANIGSVHASDDSEIKCYVANLRQETADSAIIRNIK